MIRFGTKNVARVICMLFVAATFLLLYTLTPVASAQLSPGIQAQLKMRPEYPGPYDKVQVEVKTGSVNTGTALVTWRINNEVMQQSYGGTKFTFTTGPVGSFVLLSVTLQEPTGKIVTESVEFTVADVSVTWEGRTYTPPFYRGRALHSSGSEVVFYALPQVTDRSGVLYGPSELTYEWSVSGGFREKYVENGKDYIVLRNKDQFAPFNLVLTVRDNSGEVRAREIVEVGITEPRLRLYLEHPLMGILYDAALAGKYRLQSEEGVFVAEPYFITANSRTDENLAYEWNIAGQTNDTMGRIVLRPEGAGSGEARVQLVVSNNKVWQQNSRSELDVFFNSTGVDPAQETEAL